MAKKRWTASAIQDLLPRVFPPPAHVILREVRNGTGFSRRKTRSADAVAISCWPSRGLWLGGVEIKVSRSDWQKELAIPEKAAEIQKYCRYWYVAAPKGLINEGEVPEAWGLIECDRTARITKAAPSTNETPVDLLPVCSILRSFSEQFIPRVEMQDEINKAVKSATENLHFAEQHELEKLREAIKTFESESGVSLSRPWQAGNIGRAVQALIDVNAMPLLGQARRLAKEHSRIAAQLHDLVNNLKNLEGE